MYLTKVEKSNIGEKYQKTTLLKLLDAFVAGGYDCAKVEGTREHYASAMSAHSTINHAIKTYKFRGVRCSKRGDDIYLIKTEV